MGLDRDTFREFCALLLDPEGCIEARAINAERDRHGMIVRSDLYVKTIAAWCDSIGALENLFVGQKDASVYLTVNPVRRDLLARSYNRWMVVRRGEGTTDRDILCIRWVYIDIDSVRVGGVSATQEELAAALALRDRILADHPALRAASVWGCSGNGGFILVRVADLPVGEDGKASDPLIRRVLHALAARYDDDRAKIDTKTFNASRIMCVPGTLKCKGSHTEDRPWRPVTLDSNTDIDGPWDIEGWLEEHGVEVPAVPPLNVGYSHINGTPLDRRVIGYLGAMKPAISGQKGHDQTFDAACSLVHGFGLSIAEATPYLAAWNQTHCQPPWDDRELRHKLEQADASEDRQGRPRGFLRDAERPGRNGYHGNGHAAPAAPVPPGGDATQEEGQAADVRAEDDPHRLADGFLAKYFGHPDGWRLRFWAEEWLAWDGACYREIPLADIKGMLAEHIAEVFLADFARALMRYGMKEKGDSKARPPTCRQVGTGLVANVVLALSGRCLLPLEDHPTPPAWVADSGDGREPSMVLPTRSGLVYIPDILGGDFRVRPATPLFFCKHSLEYEVSGEAADPVNWLTFLGSRPVVPGAPVQLQVWPDEPDSIALLQEWMGLNVVACTSFQKILAMIGPRRSGKGTIARVMSRLIGLANVAGPTLSDLAEKFGLEPVLGKLAAIIDDAHLSGKVDAGIIVERLLTISGEGILTVNRKHIASWTGRLSARFTIISNEVPRLNEVSTALAGRFLFLRFKRSFYGREDQGLEEKFVPELPGILLWALEGWRRLRDRGRFVQPESGAELVAEMEELSSPIGMFLQEKMRVGPLMTCDVGAAFQAWKVWCEQKGIREPGTELLFGRNLRAVVPNLNTRQVRRPHGRVRVFEGIGFPETAFDGPVTQ